MYKIGSLSFGFGLYRLWKEGGQGAFAIAFAEDFGKEEKALELFNAMTEE